MDEILGVFIVLVVIAFIWVSGFMFGVDAVRDDCRTYGKSKMFGEVYECREGENK